MPSESAPQVISQKPQTLREGKGWLGREDDFSVKGEERKERNTKLQETLQKIGEIKKLTPWERTGQMVVEVVDKAVGVVSGKRLKEGVKIEDEKIKTTQERIVLVNTGLDAIIQDLSPTEAASLITWIGEGEDSTPQNVEKLIGELYGKEVAQELAEQYRIAHEEAAYLKKQHTRDVNWFQETFGRAVPRGQFVHSNEEDILHGRTLGEYTVSLLKKNARSMLKGKIEEISTISPQRQMEAQTFAEKSVATKHFLAAKEEIEKGRGTKLNQEEEVQLSIAVTQKLREGGYSDEVEEVEEKRLEREGEKVEVLRALRRKARLIGVINAFELEELKQHVFLDQEIRLPRDREGHIIPIDGDLSSISSADELLDLFLYHYNDELLLGLEARLDEHFRLFARKVQARLVELYGDTEANRKENPERINSGIVRFGYVLVETLERFSDAAQIIVGRSPGQGAAVDLPSVAGPILERLEFLVPTKIEEEGSEGVQTNALDWLINQGRNDQHFHSQVVRTIELEVHEPFTSRAEFCKNLMKRARIVAAAMSFDGAEPDQNRLERVYKKWENAKPEEKDVLYDVLISEMQNASKVSGLLYRLRVAQQGIKQMFESYAYKFHQYTPDNEVSNSKWREIADVAERKLDRRGYEKLEEKLKKISLSIIHAWHEVYKSPIGWGAWADELQTISEAARLIPDVMAGKTNFRDEIAKQKEIFAQDNSPIQERKLKAIKQAREVYLVARRRGLNDEEIVLFINQGLKAAMDLIDVNFAHDDRLINFAFWENSGFNADFWRACGQAEGRAMWGMLAELEPSTRPAGTVVINDRQAAVLLAFTDEMKVSRQKQGAIIKLGLLATERANQISPTIKPCFSLAALNCPKIGMSWLLFLDKSKFSVKDFFIYAGYADATMKALMKLFSEGTSIFEMWEKAEDLLKKEEFFRHLSDTVIKELDPATREIVSRQTYPEIVEVMTDSIRDMVEPMLELWMREQRITSKASVGWAKQIREFIETKGLFSSKHKEVYFLPAMTIAERSRWRGIEWSEMIKYRLTTSFVTRMAFQLGGCEVTMKDGTHQQMTDVVWDYGFLGTRGPVNREYYTKGTGTLVTSDAFHLFAGVKKRGNGFEIDEELADAMDRACQARESYEANAGIDQARILGYIDQKVAAKGKAWRDEKKIREANGKYVVPNDVAKELTIEYFTEHPHGEVEKIFLSLADGSSRKIICERARVAASEAGQITPEEAVAVLTPEVEAKIIAWLEPQFYRLYEVVEDPERQTMGGLKGYMWQHHQMCKWVVESCIHPLLRMRADMAEAYSPDAADRSKHTEILKTINKFCELHGISRKDVESGTAIVGNIAIVEKQIANADRKLSSLITQAQEVKNGKRKMTQGDQQRLVSDIKQLQAQMSNLDSQREAGYAQHAQIYSQIDSMKRFRSIDFEYQKGHSLGWASQVNVSDFDWWKSRLTRGLKPNFASHNYSDDAFYCRQVRLNAKGEWEYATTVAQALDPSLDNFVGNNEFMQGSSAKVSGRMDWFSAEGEVFRTVAYFSVETARAAAAIARGISVEEAKSQGIDLIKAGRHLFLNEENKPDRTNLALQLALANPQVIKEGLDRITHGSTTSLDILTTNEVDDMCYFLYGGKEGMERFTREGNDQYFAVVPKAKRAEERFQAGEFATGIMAEGANIVGLGGIAKEVFAPLTKKTSIKLLARNEIVIIPSGLAISAALALVPVAGPVLSGLATVVWVYTAVRVGNLSVQHEALMRGTKWWDSWLLWRNPHVWLINNARIKIKIPFTKKTILDWKMFDGYEQNVERAESDASYFAGRLFIEGGGLWTAEALEKIMVTVRQELGGSMVFSSKQ